MKIYKNILVIMLLCYACDNPTSSEIPIEDSGNTTNYQTNLHSLNSGQHLEYLTINWNAYIDSTFIHYSLYTINIMKI